MAGFAVGIAGMVEIYLIPIFEVVAIRAFAGPMSGGGHVAVRALSVTGMIEIDVHPVRRCMTIGA